MTSTGKIILSWSFAVLAALLEPRLSQAAPRAYDLTVAKSGTGLGTVTSSPAGIDCGNTCTARFKANARVILTATAAAGSTFQGWAGACAGTANTCKVTMKQAKTVIADFAAILETLSVSKTGSGAGTVTSFPAGIDCGSTCSAEFEPNTQVTLTALPAAGSAFEGWSGGCAGSGSSCTVTLSQAQSVRAAFSAPAISTFQYDPNGNLTQIADPLNHVTLHEYDNLDQVVRTQQPHPDLSGLTLGQIDAEYDSLGQISRITDPRNLSTDYQVNALGDLLTLISPDTGVTSFTYDEAGNIKTQTDARGKTAVFTYDNQNRITQAGYDDQTVAYIWDNCTNGIGRLCSLNNGSSRLTFSYDLHGRLIRQSQTVGAVTLAVGYHYNHQGQRDQATTPGGQTLTYAWQNGRIASVAVNGQPLVGQIDYEPDGQVGGWIWGNNEPAQRLYDLAGRPVQIDLGFDAQSRLPEALTYHYDAAGRLQDISHQVDVSADQHHDYDGLDRLTASGRGLPIQNSYGYAYDLSGNRTAQVHNTNTTNYNVDPGSNRLQGLSGSTSKIYSYDASGHLTVDGALTYTYNAAGRRITVTGPGLNTGYAYNGLGQRVQKTVNGLTTLFVYDTQGRLLGEYDATGHLIQEIVWFANLPIAVLKPAALPNTGTDVFYIHADHLGTPRKVSRPSDNQVLWAWAGEAFGNSPPHQNPTDQGDFVFNLRFPGQYFDAETGLNYNYFRDYDPATGRYIESDPIGLAGGINTFAYVNGNPINYIDQLGLFEIINCNTAQTTKIKNACPIAQDRANKGGVGEKFSGVLDKLTFDCKPKLDEAKRACGTYFNNHIYIGVGFNNKLCSLPAVIAHEVSHSHDFNYDEAQAFIFENGLFPENKIFTPDYFSREYNYLDKRIIDEYQDYYDFISPYTRGNYF
jgi:RHS repeat-associated protein